jgi:hypothetical protein
MINRVFEDLRRKKAPNNSECRNDIYVIEHMLRHISGTDQNAMLTKHVRELAIHLF